MKNGGFSSLCTLQKSLQYSNGGIFVKVKAVIWAEFDDEFAWFFSLNLRQTLKKIHSFKIGYVEFFPLIYGLQSPKKLGASEVFTQDNKGQAFFLPVFFDENADDLLAFLRWDEVVKGKNHRNKGKNDS